MSVRRAERGGRTGTTTPAPRDGGTGTAIPAPRDALGFTPGEARKLPSWPDVVGYFDTLSAALAAGDVVDGADVDHASTPSAGGPTSSVANWFGWYGSSMLIRTLLDAISGPGQRR